MNYKRSIPPSRKHNSILWTSVYVIKTPLGLLLGEQDGLVVKTPAYGLKGPSGVLYCHMQANKVYFYSKPTRR